MVLQMTVNIMVAAVDDHDDASGGDHNENASDKHVDDSEV